MSNLMMHLFLMHHVSQHSHPQQAHQVALKGDHKKYIMFLKTQFKNNQINLLFPSEFEMQPFRACIACITKCMGAS